MWPARVRLLQPNLRIVDAVGLDVDGLIDDLADQGANAVLLNGGGMVAWYPTALAFQHPVDGLRVDFVDRAVAAAHRRRLLAIVRVDVTKTYPGGTSRPEWFRKGPDGGPVAVGPFLETCMNGPFWQASCFEILDELVGRYPLDGVFFNSFLYRPCEAACLACDTALAALAVRLGVPVGDPLVRHTWMADLATTYGSAGPRPWDPAYAADGEPG